jgi:hypothetical protein
VILRNPTYVGRNWHNHNAPYGTPVTYYEGAGGAFHQAGVPTARGQLGMVGKVATNRAGVYIRSGRKHNRRMTREQWARYSRFLVGGWGYQP